MCSMYNVHCTLSDCTGTLVIISGFEDKHHQISELHAEMLLP